MELCIYYNFHDGVEELIRRGYDLKEDNPLGFACEANKLLLEAGADPNVEYPFRVGDEYRHKSSDMYILHFCILLVKLLLHHAAETNKHSSYYTQQGKLVKNRFGDCV